MHGGGQKNLLGTDRQQQQQMNAGNDAMCNTGDFFKQNLTLQTI